MNIIDNDRSYTYIRHVPVDIGDMAQHFLLSKEAKTLSLREVANMSAAKAYSTFKAIRFADNAGEPYCISCGCAACYSFKARRLFKCKACGKQFTITSGTIFASRKLTLKDILLAIAIFTNGANGHAALRLQRDLGVQYKTAFVLAHKLREAMGATPIQGGPLKGTVEVDGAYFGGYLKPKNFVKGRVDRRLAQNRTGKTQVVVIMRERGGRSLPFVFKSERESIPTIIANVDPSAVIHADESSAYDALDGRFDTKRINHKVAYSDGNACTNSAENYFSRLRRAEQGVHHHIAGPYLDQYANEMAWRDTHRRVSNGAQFGMIVSAAAQHPVSRRWKGYWQRRAEDAT